MQIPTFRALALAVCTALAACAQQPAAQKSPSQPAATPPKDGARRDPQNQIEPRSAPGEGQTFLARMEGSWSVVKTFYPRSGEPAVTKGECRQHMVHGGRFLQSGFVFHDPGGDSTGTGIIGFDPQTGRFTSFWVDSRSTRFSVRQSTEPFDGTKIHLNSETVGDPGPNARHTKTISTLEDNDRRLIHRQFGQNADGTDRLVMQLEMVRTGR